MPHQPHNRPDGPRYPRNPRRGAPEFCARYQCRVVPPVPLLLIDLETKEGVTGRSYLFCYLRAAVPAIT